MAQWTVRLNRPADFPLNSSITSRRVQYALGYLELGMLNEASEELEAVAFDDRFRPDVLAARIELGMTAKHWAVVVGLGQELTARAPELERGWIGWAYALRELGRVAEAKEVLLKAEPRHGAESATLHYNLACYHCLLGEREVARMRLTRACGMHPEFKESALEDPDLKALWEI